MLIPIRPPSRLDRFWFVWLGLSVPWRMTRDGFPTRLVRLVPQQLTPLHRAWARFHGWWWHPCPSCGQGFGAHQVSVAVAGVLVCPWCVRALTGADRGDMTHLSPRAARSPWVLAAVAGWFTLETAGTLLYSIGLGLALGGERFAGDPTGWLMQAAGLVLCGFCAVAAAGVLVEFFPPWREARVFPR
ncbi:MAG: hypothetical protein HOY78_02125 [Saccharothrix sp.]|nr:hypothetical protein [Saccharothrix sp.]